MVTETNSVTNKPSDWGTGSTYANAKATDKVTECSSASTKSSDEGSKVLP